MSKPNKYTDNIKSNLTYTFLSVSTKLKKQTLCPWTLCMVAAVAHLETKPVRLDF